MKACVQPQGAVVSLQSKQSEGCTRRWRSVVVVTNSFHQLRSYLTFRCAVQQSSPQDRQVQASACSTALLTISVM